MSKKEFYFEPLYIFVMICLSCYSYRNNTLTTYLFIQQILSKYYGPHMPLDLEDKSINKGFSLMELISTVRKTNKWINQFRVKTTKNYSGI